MTPRPTAYADRKRPAPRLYPPRNAIAADRARATSAPLVISFVGETPYRWPTLFCDPGRTYDWSCLGPRVLDPEYRPELYKGPRPVAQVIVVVKPGIGDLRAAFAAILERTDCSTAYPAVVDIEQRELAFIVHRPEGGAQLWPAKSGTELWQQYFEPTS